MSVKVTMIGGGSSSFVPSLLRRLIESNELGDTRLTLMDVNAKRLETMVKLAGKLVEAEASPLEVTGTLDQRESLRDADFVIAAISVGGMEAWADDIEIPGRYGIFMNVADSVGPGGIFRTLRNAPVLESVARDVAEVAPGAQIFNYTNPAPVEALAMLTVPDAKVTSLCSCTQHPASAEWLARQAGVQPELIEMPPLVAGINHCAGIKELRLRDGRDGLELARRQAAEPIVKFALETYGMLPYCWAHWTEFFPQMQRLEQQYEDHAQGMPMRYGITIHDMEGQSARVSELAELAEAWTSPEAGPVGLADLPPGDEEEGIEVIEIMEAIVANRSEVHVVNARNEGSIPNLPDDAVVECLAEVNGHGVMLLRAGPLPEALAAHLRHYVAVQKQMVKAALSGSRLDLLHAFLLDPMTQAHLDLEQTESMMDEMLAANADFLPRFAAASQM
jgi:alpha-galactosidase